MAKKTPQDLAFEKLDSGIPDAVERRYNQMLSDVGKKTWSGVLQVAGSGFGKGLLLTAALLVVGSTLAWGFGATLGQVGTTGALGPVTATIEQGMAIGLQVGLSMLTHGYGLAMLAIGGTLGAVAETQKEQGKVRAALAEALEKDRNDAKAQEKAAAPALPAPDVAAPSATAPVPPPPQPATPQPATPQAQAAPSVKEKETIRETKSHTTIINQAAPHIESTQPREEPVEPPTARTVDTLPEIAYEARELARRAAKARAQLNARQTGERAIGQ